MNRKLTINDRVISVGEITNKAAKESQLAMKKGADFNDTFLLESLKAGGHAPEEAQEIIDSLGFFTTGPELNEAALDVNGLRKPRKGEDQPAGPAGAESISIGSTVS